MRHKTLILLNLLDAGWNTFPCFSIALPCRLRTGYVKQAERKASRLAGAVEDFISEIRQEHPLIMNLSTEQPQSLLDQYLRKV